MSGSFLYFFTGEWHPRNRLNQHLFSIDSNEIPTSRGRSVEPQPLPLNTSERSLLLERSMLESPLLVYLSITSLGSKVSCIVISYLVLWSICLSVTLIHSRKGPFHLMWEKRCPRGVRVNALDFGIVISEFELQRTTTFTFGAIPPVKVWTPLSSNLWVK